MKEKRRHIEEKLIRVGSVSRVIHFLLGRCSYYYTSLGSIQLCVLPATSNRHIMGSLFRLAPSGMAVSSIPLVFSAG